VSAEYKEKEVKAVAEVIADITKLDPNKNLAQVYAKKILDAIHETKN
jgi:hypothetical protein